MGWGPARPPGQDPARSGGGHCPPAGLRRYCHSEQREESGGWRPPALFCVILAMRRIRDVAPIFEVLRQAHNDRIGALKTRCMHRITEMAYDLALPGSSVEASRHSS